MPVRHRRYGGTPQTALADYIKQNSRRWIEAWLDAVKTDGGTEHYHNVEDTAELIRDTEALYHYLALWLRTAKWDSRIDPHYERIGRCRREAGFPLNEVIRASLLAKRHLWDGIAAGCQLSTGLELEASKAIGWFYDRAIYHTIVGYEQDQD